MDLLMADNEGPNTQAAIEALNKGERNMTKWRNPADVDSSVKRFPEPVSVDELIGQKTNPKGSTASLYEPMGAPAAARVPQPQPQPAAAFDEFNPPSADEMRPRWDRAQAETNAIALERFPQLSGQREATPDEFGLWSAALDRLKRRGLMNAAEDASAGTQVLASNQQHRAQLLRKQQHQDHNRQRRRNRRRSRGRACPAKRNHRHPGRRATPTRNALRPVASGSESGSATLAVQPGRGADSRAAASCRALAAPLPVRRRP